MFHSHQNPMIQNDLDFDFVRIQNYFIKSNNHSIYYCSSYYYFCYITILLVIFQSTEKFSEFKLLKKNYLVVKP